MKIADYQKTLKEKLAQTTLCLLIKNSSLVLLGLKKKGVGKGKLVGIGGKIKKGETIKQAAIREVVEEIKVTLFNIKRVATLNFYFPYIANPKRWEQWEQQVCVFTCHKWRGIPQESTEIIPQWFSFSKIPYQLMWSDASYWLPQVLKGQKVKGSFLFDKEDKVEDVIITIGKY